MYCIIGLGNPGEKYYNTRHNIGFLVLNAYASGQDFPFQKGAGPYQICNIDKKQAPVLLIKPMTYMNRSGIAVDDVIKRYSLSLKKILVIFDDIHLVLGRLRVRPSGSDGGHNGTASIINYLRTNQFPRLRLGVGKPTHGDIVQHVLSPFTQREIPLFQEVVLKSKNLIDEFMNDGLQYVMNQYNC